MDCIIGGSQSTGTSLLRQILHRHDDVFCLNESHILCKPEIYQNWKKHKNKLPNNGLLGLKSAGWNVFTGLNLSEENNIQKADLKTILKNAESLKDAMKEMKSRVCKEKILIDKTPPNLFCMSDFLTALPETKAIVCVRNPYDVAASLMNRDMSLIDTTAVIISSIVESLKLIEHPQIHFLKYENLVNKSEQVIQDVCKFLDIEYSDHILIPSQNPNEEPLKIEGWNYDERGAIGNESVGRFKTLNLEKQKLIVEALNAIQWMEEKSALERFCNAFDYACNLVEPSKEILQQLQDEKRKSLWERTRRMHHYTLFNDPITIPKG